MTQHQGKTLADNRPLSPHLGIYKWPLTMALSILHRATGVALFAGTLLLTWWIILNAYSTWLPNEFLAEFFRSVLGKLVLLGWSGSLFYHMCNGVRHLLWDIGIGFEIHTAKKSGIAVLIATAILTALSWCMAFCTTV